MTSATPSPLRGLGSALLLLLLPLLGGCGSVVAGGPRGETTPTPLPELEGPERPYLSTPASPSPALPEPDSSRVLPLDPILDSPWAHEPGMKEEVNRWIESFRTREAALFRQAMSRMGEYREVVEEGLRERRLPPSLAYLPIVESWYSPTAVSWVGAAGLWQFMPPTARGMGLQVDRLVDERRDPFRATPLALDFLQGLNARFHSWFLALAAYNGGPGRMERVLRRRGGEPSDGLFFEIRRDLPRETRNFVPRFLAAATIARDPAAYGFEDLEPRVPSTFDEVEVPDAATLDVVAQAAGVSQEELERLNPQLLRGLTPAGRTTRLRVPAGRGGMFRTAFARVPPEERVTFLEHTVQNGETLTHIARRHGVDVADLRAANPDIRPRRMQIGQRVIVPKAPSARAAPGRPGGAQGGGEEVVVVYRVQAGDTLSTIAIRHRVGVADLLRWNDLSLSSIIRPGDEVRLYYSGGG